MFKAIIFSLLLGIASESRIIISFKSNKCADVGFNHQEQLEKKASNLLLLHNVEMMILDISKQDFSDFLLEFKDFMECIHSFKENEHIESPPQTKEFLGDDDKDFYEWHLKRINTLRLPLPKYFSRKIRSSNPVHVFLLDSGIYKHSDYSHLLAPPTEHISFVEEACCPFDKLDPFCDCNGQGTHNAGLIASTKVGYNPEAFLHSIKISDQKGVASKENIIKGIDKVIEIVKANYAKGLNIISLSINTFYDLQINMAEDRLIKENIILIVSAGDSNMNACTLSPTNFPAFVIGASDINDNKTEDSNFGNCIYSFSPGEKVYSCKPNGGYQFRSGTSTAAAFFTGFASAVAAQREITKSPDLRNALKLFTNIQAIQESNSMRNNLPFDGKIVVQ